MRKQTTVSERVTDSMSTSSKLTKVTKNCVKYTVACKDDMLAVLIVWFHLNKVGIFNSIDDFCFFFRCNFPYHIDPYCMTETD
jgi:hypothetical protein